MPPKPPSRPTSPPLRRKPRVPPAAPRSMRVAPVERPEPSSRDQRSQPARTQPDGKKVLEVITGEILDLKERTGRHLYAIGVRLAQVRDEALWRYGRYRGFEDYLERGVKFSRSTAYELLRLSRHFTEEVAGRYGFDKLRAVMAWMNVTPKLELAGDVFRSRIRVRGDQGRFVNKTLHTATATEIRQSIDLLKDNQVGSVKMTRDLHARLRKLEKILPPAPRGTQSGRRVRLRRGRDGTLAVTFQAIPLDELEAFVSALKQWMA